MSAQAIRGPIVIDKSSRPGWATTAVIDIEVVGGGGEADVARSATPEAFSDVAGTLHLGLPKSGKERTVAIPRFLCELLAPAVAGKGAEELAFVAPEGGPVRQSNYYNRQFKPAVEAAGWIRTCGSTTFATRAPPSRFFR